MVVETEGGVGVGAGVGVGVGVGSGVGVGVGVGSGVGVGVGVGVGAGVGVGVGVGSGVGVGVGVGSGVGVGVGSGVGVGLDESPLSTISCGRYSAVGFSRLGGLLLVVLAVSRANDTTPLLVTSEVTSKKRALFVLLGVAEATVEPTTGALA
jgi:hypothetical protein